MIDFPYENTSGIELSESAFLNDLRFLKGYKNPNSKLYAIIKGNAYGFTRNLNYLGRVIVGGKCSSDYPPFYPELWRIDS